MLKKLNLDEQITSDFNIEYVQVLRAAFFFVNRNKQMDSFVTQMHTFQSKLFN